ncbi:MAG TPA: DUF4838 domain-containing protein [Verrucomicrobiae bacterium]|nr:DUF4838 domain-containing protein [Verrucomicrobiae bacterium]
MKTKEKMLFSLVSILTFGILQSLELHAAEAVPIFDGKSLNGWEGNITNWRVERGAIVGGELDRKQPHNEFLATTKEFGDFELRLQYKIEGSNGFVNGGVQFWSQRVPNNFEVSGYQADLGAATDGNLYDESRRNKNLVEVPRDILEKALKPGAWNDYRIRAEGSHIQLWLNGVKTVDYMEPDASIPRHGIIALQIHGGAYTKVQYRKLVLKELVETAGLNLAEHGQTKYSIIVAPDATTTVKHAAQELSDDLKEISGADFPVLTEKRHGPSIFVGACPWLPSAFNKVRLDDLTDEAFVIRSSGRNLLLAGHGDRGTLYAVYSFVEDKLGARWYAPDATFFPHRDTIRLASLSETQIPAFSYRNTDETIVHIPGHAQWDAHLKLNGMSVPDEPDLGGINRLFNGAENFYDLVPPSRYFAGHPEYFSLVKGKRKSSPDSQLCLSNPDVFKLVVAALIAEAKASPQELTLGLSPNDATHGNCQCDACKAADAKFGSPGGTLLDFVNKVAAAVQASFPDRKIWVETLAYQYTQKAPTPEAIAPADNVLVCLAPIYACDGHSLAADPQNKASNQALLDWEKVAPGHLQIWHYVVNFAHYLQPYPDWDEIGADMEYYRDNGVSGMYCEGDSASGCDFQPMHTWVMAHLFWNPRQDVWSLVRDFCNGYFGKAGAEMYAYQRLFHERLQQPGVHLHLYDPPTSSLFSADLLKSANALVERAEADAENETIRNRVQETRMGLRYIYLATHIPDSNTAPDQRGAYRTKLNSFIADLARFNITSLSEGHSAEEWIKRFKAAAGE